MKYFEYRSIADMNNVIIRRLYILPHDIDLIVGVPRSGMLPANLIALYLNKPFTDIDSFIQGRVYSSGERGAFINSNNTRKVLIVDDSYASGKAYNKVKLQLKDVETLYDIKFAAIFITSKGKNVLDYYFEVIDYPRFFQWNIFHHNMLNKSCFDIDGVLCLDPPVDDDGPIYKNYIATATPLYIPSVPIDTIVSCRLEKYRKITEEWLKTNGVRYSKLILLNMETLEQRQKWGKHGEYKAQVYKKSDDVIFIESSLSQAITISKISQKPVFCTETFEIINNHSQIKRQTFKLKKIIKNVIKMIICKK